MSTRLSDRIRPNSEAAPWVVEEIKVLEGRLAAIEKAVADYHYALDTRQHGGVAQDTAFDTICQVLGASWRRGEEKKRREDSNNKGDDT